jgi:hypothetical protein
VARVRIESTPDGRRVVASRVVDAPVDRTWTVLRDTGLWPAWGPSVSAVDCADRLVRAGSTGRVRAAGVWVPFRVTDCADYRWTWDVAGVPATGHAATSLADGRSRASIEVPALAAPYAVVCAVAVDRIARLAIDGAGRGSDGDDDGRA